MGVVKTTALGRDLAARSVGGGGEGQSLGGLQDFLTDMNRTRVGPGQDSPRHGLEPPKDGATPQTQGLWVEMDSGDQGLRSSTWDTFE